MALGGRGLGSYIQDQFLKVWSLETLQKFLVRYDLNIRCPKRFLNFQTIFQSLFILIHLYYLYTESISVNKPCVFPALGTFWIIRCGSRRFLQPRSARRPKARELVSFLNPSQSHMLKRSALFSGQETAKRRELTQKYQSHDT